MTTVVIKDGELWGCGLIKRPQLCPKSDISSLVKIPAPSGIKFQFVTNNVTSIVAIDMNFKLWVCGDNTCGNLGLGRIKYVNDLTPVMTNVEIIYVEIGTYNTVLLDKTGKIWFTGEFPHYFEDISIKKPKNQKTFCCISDGIDIRFNKVGINCSNLMAIDNNGCLWHYNSVNLELQKVDLEFKQYNPIQNSTTNFKLMLSLPHFVFYDNFGFFWCYSCITRKLHQHLPICYRDELELSQKQYIPKLQTFTNQIVEMHTHSSNNIIIRDSNNDYWWYLGSGQGVKPIKYDHHIDQMRCYGSHMVHLDSNSNIYMEGDNSYGQLGLGYCSNNKFDCIKIDFIADNLSGIPLKSLKIKSANSAF